MNSITKREFPSIRAFAAYVDGAKRIKGAGDSSEADGRGKDWDLDMSYRDAVKCGLAGGNWADGARQMREVSLETARLVENQGEQVLDYDVTGHILDVAEYCAGNPDHWITDGDDDASRAPIIRVGVSVGRAARVDSEFIVNRGAAILSVIDKLENDGLRVELFAVCDMGDTDRQVTSILIKGADQQWAPASAAFALCHPAFSRHLAFKYMEVTPKLCRETKSGYGYGGGQDKTARGDFDVYFAGIVSASGFETPAEAVKEAVRQFSEQMTAAE